MHQENDKIERYKIYLRLEKALSANSIDAYLTDLDKLTNFVESEGKKYADVTYDDLQQFVARLRDIGIHPRSQARIISGIKSFYRFLLLDNYITTDPTELLESPKIGLKLPEVLTVNEINNILDTIDLTLPEGQRNRACLKYCIVADYAYRNWSRYASRMFISTKGSSKWKEKGTSNGWSPSRERPSGRSRTTCMTAIMFR